jgi:hypothetical protein
MFKEPERRYQNAAELAADLDRFLNDEPITARPPSLTYKWGKRIKKNKWTFTAVSAAVVILLSFGAYYWIQWYKQFGGWELVYHKDFTDPDVDLNDLSFHRFDIETESEKIKPFPVSEKGMVVSSGNMLWLRDVKAEGYVRVEIVMEGAHDVELFINTQKKQTAKWSMAPRGYAAKFGAFGVIHALCINREAQWPSITYGVKDSLQAEGTCTLGIERFDGMLYLLINGRRVYMRSDTLPLRGEGFENIGFRSWGDTTIVRTITVYRRRLAMRTTPVLAGDALYEKGYLKDAFLKYLTVAEDFKDTLYEPESLCKAYLVSQEIEGISEQDREMVFSRMNSRYSDTDYFIQMQEARASALWRRGKYSASLAQLPQ